MGEKEKEEERKKRKREVLGKRLSLSVRRLLYEREEQCLSKSWISRAFSPSTGEVGTGGSLGLAGQSAELLNFKLCGKPCFKS